MHSTFRAAVLALGSAIGLTFALAVPAAAHPAPFAQVTVELRDQDEFEMLIVADLPALLMQAEPGHLTAEQQSEFRALSTGERRSLLDAARRSLQNRLAVEIDGRPAAVRKVAFPTADEFQGTDADAHLPIRVWGDLPEGAATLRLKLPADLGPVKLALRPWNGPAVQQTLQAGEASWPLVVRADTRAAPPTGPSADADPLAEPVPAGPSWAQFYTACFAALIGVGAAAVLALRRGGSCRVHATSCS